VAFGFDEEASGLQGAGYLASHLEEVYGRDGLALIVDEGTGFQERFGSVLATPGIAEKGYLDTHVKVTAPGGHSSVPPAHTVNPLSFYYTLMLTCSQEYRNSLSSTRPI
jgi:Gly-Xaa carboxypeptidase